MSVYTGLPTARLSKNYGAARSELLQISAMLGGNIAQRAEPHVIPAENKAAWRNRIYLLIAVAVTTEPEEEDLFHLFYGAMQPWRARQLALGFADNALSWLRSTDPVGEYHTLRQTAAGLLSKAQTAVRATENVSFDAEPETVLAPASDAARELTASFELIFRHSGDNPVCPLQMPDELRDQWRDHIFATLIQAISASGLPDDQKDVAVTNASRVLDLLSNTPV